MQIKETLTLIELNDFWKRNTEPFDYIYVCGKVKESETFFYKNFYDFNFLFNEDNKILNCDIKYITNNFEQITLEQIQKELK
jgi:hypothetical protein